MLKAIHAQESRAAAQAKARDVVKALRAMKLRKGGRARRAAIDETLTYYAYPAQHWIKLKTNNPMERVRSKRKVQGQWQPSCIAHNIEKLMNYGTTTT